MAYYRPFYRDFRQSYRESPGKNRLKYRQKRCNQGGTLGADIRGCFLTRNPYEKTAFRVWSDRVLTEMAKKCGLIVQFIGCFYDIFSLKNDYFRLISMYRERDLVCLSSFVRY